VAFLNEAHDDMYPTDPDAGSQGSVPCNFAYDAEEGYTGLLLYKLSPRLAEAVYPIITTQAAEVFVSAMQIISMTGALPPLLYPNMPPELAYLSLLVYIPALHRLALLHTRRFLLLLRQFELWWVVRW
jgi:hypothetical protein